MLTHVLTLPYTLFYKPLLIFGFKRGCVVHPCCVYTNHQCYYISLPMFYWCGCCCYYSFFYSCSLFVVKVIIIIFLIWCNKDYVGCVTIVLFAKYYSCYWCYYYYCIVITITITVYKLRICYFLTPIWLLL